MIPECNNSECTREDHATGRARSDVATLERAGEALIRSGHTQTAIEVLALALRVRTENGLDPQNLGRRATDA